MNIEVSVRAATERQKEFGIVAKFDLGISHKGIVLFRLYDGMIKEDRDGNKRMVYPSRKADKKYLDYWRAMPDSSAEDRKKNEQFLIEYILGTQNGTIPQQVPQEGTDSLPEDHFAPDIPFSESELQDLDNQPEACCPWVRLPTEG